MQPREAERLHSATAPPSLQLIAFCRNLHQPAAAHYKTSHSALTLHAFLSGSHPSGAFKQYPELEIRAESQPSLLGSISSGKKLVRGGVGCRASLCGSLRCFLCAESGQRAALNVQKVTRCISFSSPSSENSAL